MTQFMLVRWTSRSPVVGPSLVLVELRTGDPFLDQVATHYFGPEWRCWKVQDHSTRLEPVIDRVWSTRGGNTSILQTEFVAFLAALVAGQCEFVCWQGSDYLGLPAAHTWDEVLAQVDEQTRSQPADLFLHYRPHASDARSGLQ